MQLISKDNNQGQGLSPYPLFLASPITSPIAETISTISEWIIEPKWDEFEPSSSTAKKEQLFGLEETILFQNNFQTFLMLPIYYPMVFMMERY